MNHLRILSLVPVLIFLASTLHAHPAAKTAARAGMHSVTPEHMQQAILDYVRSQKDDTVADIQVRLLEPEQSVSLPGGASVIRVRPVLSAEGYGRREFDVTLSINGAVMRTVRATADISALVEVAVATRLIKINETIQADDVTIARTLLTVTPGQYAGTLDEVIGKRAARPLAPRAPISLATLAEPYLVRKGDRVTIEAKRKGLLIQTIGIMKAVGQIGQTVTVTNQDSGKDLRAKVVGPGLVRVEF
jgi:flagella basal body P-ring formation protein FlgA